MRAGTLLLGGVLLLLAVRPLLAEEPLAPDTKDAVEGTVGNDAVQLRYLMQAPLKQRSDLDFGLLIAQDRQFVASAALMFNTNFAGVPGLQINVGPQVYAGWLNGVARKTQVFAVAAGVNARYEVLQQYHIGVFIHAFYSPGIITFGAADNVYDFAAGADARITDRLTVLAGYRWFKITLEQQPDDRLQNEVFAGLRWRLH